MIRVAIADDQAVVRMGLRVLVEREQDMEVVGEAEDGYAALDLVRATQPDVLLLDIRMPGLDGLGVLSVAAAEPELAATRVVVVTTFEVDEYVFRALRAGASGFVLKDAPPADIVRAVREAASGGAMLSPSVTRRVIAALGKNPVGGAGPVAGMDQLTERERELVAWVATGRTNEEIGEALFISSATVRTHVGRAMQKLGARDRAQLVVLALRAGLTLPDES